MTKGGKLTKLTSMLKKWNSFSKQSGGRSDTNATSITNHSSGESNDNQQYHQAVYVGKSRRQYLISPEVMEHPLIQELVERSGCGNNDGDNNYVVVGCEVVMFDHLLWMLDNGDPQPESLNELVDFYSS